MNRITLIDLARKQPLEPSLARQVQARAYELYEQRGKGQGFALQDWLEAETEVLRFPARSGYGASPRRPRVAPRRGTDALLLLDVTGFIEHAIPAVAISQIQSDGELLPRKIRYISLPLRC